MHSRSDLMHDWIPLLPPPRRWCFHRSLFVCLFFLLDGLRKNITQLIFTQFDGTWATGPLDFGGNSDHVTLGVGLWLSVIRWGWAISRRHWVCAQCLFDRNNLFGIAGLGGVMRCTGCHSSYWTQVVDLNVQITLNICGRSGRHDVPPSPSAAISAPLYTWENSSVSFAVLCWGNPWSHTTKPIVNSPPNEEFSLTLTFDRSAR